MSHRQHRVLFCTTPPHPTPSAPPSPPHGGEGIRRSRLNLTPTPPIRRSEIAPWPTRHIDRFTPGTGQGGEVAIGGLAERRGEGIVAAGKNLGHQHESGLAGWIDPEKRARCAA